MWARLSAAICLTLLAPFVFAAYVPPDHGMRLTVKARPQIMLFGGNVRVECRVPRIRTYTSVTYGIEGPSFSTSSSRMLPGPVVYEMLTQMPRNACGTHYAFCVVSQADRLGTVSALPVPILVKGIGCPEEELQD
jgi:hypothetical protein